VTTRKAHLSLNHLVIDAAIPSSIKKSASSDWVFLSHTCIDLKICVPSHTDPSRVPQISTVERDVKGPSDISIDLKSLVSVVGAQ
jgi:hypothetical protein